MRMPCWPSTWLTRAWCASKEPLMPGIAHTRHVVWPQVTSARDQPASEPFLLRTHGESNEVGGVHAFTGGMPTHTPACVHHGARYALAGRYMYVELLDAPGFGPGPVVEQKSTSPASRGRSDPLLLEHLPRARTHTAYRLDNGSVTPGGRRRSSSQRSPDARTSSPTRGAASR